MERPDEQVLVVLPVMEAHREQALVGGSEHAVVHRLLHREDLRVEDVVAGFAHVDREPEPIGLGRFRQDQVVQPIGERFAVALLQAESIDVVGERDVGELVTRRVLAEVVADDLQGDAPLSLAPRQWDA